MVGVKMNSWNVIADFGRLSPCLSINDIAWRPQTSREFTNDTKESQSDNTTIDIAIAGDDSSLRVISLTLSSSA